jgi:hypothetical protein
MRKKIFKNSNLSALLAFYRYLIILLAIVHAPIQMNANLGSHVSTPNLLRRKKAVMTNATSILRSRRKRSKSSEDTDLS